MNKNDRKYIYRNIINTYTNNNLRFCFSIKTRHFGRIFVAKVDNHTNNIISLLKSTEVIRSGK